MSLIDFAYHGVLNNLLALAHKAGDGRKNRTDVKTVSKFCNELRVDTGMGLPLISTKEVHYRSVLHELLWFLSGSTNIQYLKENKVRIWDEWADETGSVGPMYGYMWRSFPDGSTYTDQIRYLLDTLKAEPESRRAMLSAWNPAYLPDTGRKPKENPVLGKQALAPCHVSFQLLTTDCNDTGAVLKRRKATARNLGVDADTAKYVLNLQYTMRSSDVFLGKPFNIASYATLLYIFCRELNMLPGELVAHTVDTHLYMNHVEAATLQEERYLKGMGQTTMPELHIKAGSLFGPDPYKFEDFELVGYCPAPAIKVQVAV